MKNSKEKALNLCQKFGWVSITWEQTNYTTLSLENAKQCALIACDEVIEYLTSSSDIMISVNALEYWQQVKTEINLL
jgi:hypothetical protein